MAGFEVDLAAALARELGVRAELVQCDWSTLVPALERGAFDIVMNGLEATVARERQMYLSRPYYLFAERVVVRREHGTIRPIAELASLAGKRVGTLSSSLAWDMLESAGVERIPYEGVQEPFLDLERGRIDAVVIDDIIVDRYGRRPGLVALGDIGSGQYVVGVRKDDPELGRAIDQALGRLIDSGELRSILARWKIDGPRQEGLARPPPMSAVGGLASSSRARPLSDHQVMLFVRAAGITLVISAAAMALAMMGGLVLALARLPSRLRWRPTRSTWAPPWPASR
jgi:polar amino acid transport system substrate-binding protein